MDKNGFTIIELIVVIAIIAILAAIVMVLLNNQIAKSHDTVVKSDLNSLYLKANLFSAEKNGGGFGSFCNDAETQAILNKIDSILPSGYQSHCHASENDWEACAVLSNKTRAWCVDYTGIKIEMNEDRCKDSGEGAIQCKDVGHGGGGK